MRLHRRKVQRDRPEGPAYIETMSVVSMRTAAAWLLALLTLALPPVVRDDGRAISGPDAPWAYNKPQNAKVLRPQLLVVAKDERQRLSGSASAVLPSRAAALLASRLAISTSRLSELGLRLWPRVGPQRDAQPDRTIVTDSSKPADARPWPCPSEGGAHCS